MAQLRSTRHVRYMVAIGGKTGHYKQRSRVLEKCSPACSVTMRDDHERAIATVDRPLWASFTVYKVFAAPLSSITNCLRVADGSARRVARLSRAVGGVEAFDLRHGHDAVRRAPRRRTVPLQQQVRRHPH